MVFPTSTVHLVSTGPLDPLMKWHIQAERWAVSLVTSADMEWRALAHEASVALSADELGTALEHCRRLMAAGMPPDTPVLMIRPSRNATPARSARILTDLAGIASSAHTTHPALILIGALANRPGLLSWYAQRPLLGARIALTRSLEASASSAGTVLALGGTPLVLPLTRTVAVGPDHPRWPDIARVSSALDGYQWLMFTSAQGVACFLDLVIESGRGLDALSELHIACVGQATAKALRARGLHADVIPEHGSGHAVAEAMIAHAGGHLQGARVLFPRALEGREEAVLGLREAGADVDLMPVYQTVLASADDRADDDSSTVLASGLRMLERGRIDAIAFFAPSQVDGLFDILGPAARELVRACPLVAAIGNTTKASLTRRSVDVHVVAPSPSAEQLMRALADAWQARESR